MMAYRSPLQLLAKVSRTMDKNVYTLRSNFPKERNISSCSWLQCKAEKDMYSGEEPPASSHRILTNNPTFSTYGKYRNHKFEDVNFIEFYRGRHTLLDQFVVNIKFVNLSLLLVYGIGGLLAGFADQIGSMYSTHLSMGATSLAFWTCISFGFQRNIVSMAVDENMMVVRVRYLDIYGQKQRIFYHPKFILKIMDDIDYQVWYRKRLVKYELKMNVHYNPAAHPTLKERLELNSLTFDLGRGTIVDKDKFTAVFGPLG